MRILLLFRGASGSGKSTFIQKHGLLPYTLSADDIRLQYSAPVYDVNGNIGINQKNNKIVWDTLYSMLETRMQNGDFTVCDATNTTIISFSEYRKLAKKYRYRIYCIDMTDVSLEELLRRNQERDEYKRVPEFVIRKQIDNLSKGKIPSDVKMIKPDDYESIFYKPPNFSEHKKIHVIGDIHGCYSILMKYFDNNGGIKDNEAYIFTGDYVDRGIENAETIKWILDNYERPNFIFLEGNHEKWLWDWANSKPSKSKVFETETKVDLDKNKISKKSVRMFYRKLWQCCYFTFNNKTFLASHGGLPCLPDNLTLVSTSQLINGVGSYDDAEYVDTMFVANTQDNIYQIHGHRNKTNAPVHNTDRTYNLEGSVEFGGDLRVVVISENGIEDIKLQNTVYAKSAADSSTSTVYDLVQAMRADDNIIEKNFDNISSFNFSREAFKNKAWTDIVTKARGLFIDINNYKIAARSYNKFFNINEMPETQLEVLKNTLKFPVTAYEKENGFLGIVGWNEKENDLLITSKSDMKSDFASQFKRDLYGCYSEDTIKMMKEYIKKHNVSFVFECCDPVFDPHIIEYPEIRVFLLDVIDNTVAFSKLPYDDLKLLADKFGLRVKEKAYTLNTWEEFLLWYNNVCDENYTYNHKNIEGFVIEDSTGFMMKVKTYYYRLWKKLRTVVGSINKYGNYKNVQSLQTPIEKKFYYWYKEYTYALDSDDRNELKNKTGYDSNIISLRNKFLEWQKEK